MDNPNLLRIAAERLGAFTATCVIDDEDGVQIYECHFIAAGNAGTFLIGELRRSGENLWCPGLSPIIPTKSRLRREAWTGYQVIDTSPTTLGRAFCRLAQHVIPHPFVRATMPSVDDPVAVVNAARLEEMIEHCRLAREADRFGNRPPRPLDELLRDVENMFRIRLTAQQTAIIRERCGE